MAGQGGRESLLREGGSGSEHAQAESGGDSCSHGFLGWLAKPGTLPTAYDTVVTTAVLRHKAIGPERQRLA